MLNKLLNAPIFSNSIRVFFPLAAIIAIMVPMYTVTAIVNSYPFKTPFFSLYEWHGFEMIFVFFYTLIIGFILTAGAHWTGKKPVSGLPLVMLLIIWIFDQILLFISPSIYLPIMTSFLLGITLVFQVGKLLNGYKQKWLFIFSISVLTVVKVIFLYGASKRGFVYKDSLYEVAIWIYTLLTIIIGGRITPNFTKNFLKLPQAINTPSILVKTSIVFTALSVTSIFINNSIYNSLVFGVAGLASLLKILYWKPVRALKNPIIGMLHVGYLTLSLSLIIKGLSYHYEVLNYTRASLHILLSGGISIMALNIMVRAGLGHTGREIKLTYAIGAMYISIIIGMLIRFLVPLISPNSFVQSLHHSMGFWTLAFLIYFIKFIPIVFSKRLDDK